MQLLYRPSGIDCEQSLLRRIGGTVDNISRNEIRFVHTTQNSDWLIYRVYKKKLNRFEIALNFAKHLFVSGFLYIYIASLGTYNVE